MADEAQIIKDVFASVFKGSKTTMTRAELKAVMTKLNPSLDNEGLEGLFNEMDQNKNGVIEYTEFVDFVCQLTEGDGEPSGPPARAETRGTLLDIDKLRAAVSGNGAWAFACDQEASAIRNIVREFPEIDFQSAEGLTLAEEFVLVWLDEITGQLAEYSYFGSDEPYHNALFGACLIGLKARGRLQFVERKCHFTGTWFKLQLSGGPPDDSKALQAVYEELSTQPDTSLKMWFEQKSGKWGNDTTTQAVLSGLVTRGVLEEICASDANKQASFKLLDPAPKKSIIERLRKVTCGEVEADSRSLALLALCRTADQRDTATNQLMESIFGKEKCSAMTPKVDELVRELCSFKGVGAEELNRMIDMLPGSMQQHLASEEFWGIALAKFKELDVQGNGKLDPEELAQAVSSCMSESIVTKLAIKGPSLQSIILLFDTNQDGSLQEEEFVGFLMWCKAMEALA